MISTELHNKKPYALPVQCFPYDGLKENDLRRLITELIKEMVAHGMKVAGIATCILWARGSEPICRDGPISRWRLQSMY